jgi:hypothetical protein
MRAYNDLLTADVNDKGVLDIDTVKGCTAGMSAKPGVGCYDTCYAAKIAKFRGIDFSKSVTRTVQGSAHADSIVKAVKAAPNGFFRIGTMGDPCHAWEETVGTVEWLAPYAAAVIITKHWHRASDDQFQRLVACGAVLNTSLSALDTPVQLIHRERELKRYAGFGGHSVARIVSCEFNVSDPIGERMNRVQRRLLSLSPMIDNPLRADKSHQLVKSGVIKLTKIHDLNSIRTISLENKSTYLGHCDTCPDICGLSTIKPNHPRPASPQHNLI